MKTRKAMRNQLAPNFRNRSLTVSESGGEEVKDLKQVSTLDFFPWR